MATVQSRPATSSFTRFESAPAWALISLAAAIYIVVGALSLQLLIKSENVSPIWPGSAVMVAMLARLNRRRWGWVLLGQFAGAMIVARAGSAPWPSVICYALSSFCEALLAALILTRFGTGVVDFSSIGHVLRLVVAAIPGSALSGLLVTGANHLAANGVDPFGFWQIWTLANGVGMLAVVPALMTFDLPASRQFWSASKFESTIMFGVFLLLNYFLFCHHLQPGNYVFDRPLLATVPFLMWVPLRTNVLGTSLASMLLVGFAVGGSMHGLGPYVGVASSPLQLLRIVQLTLMGWIACGLGISVAMQRAHAGLEAASREQERFQQLTDHIDEVFWMAPIGVASSLYISPAYEKVWGRSRQSLMDNPMSFLEAIHPDDLEKVKKVLPVQDTGKPFSHEYRVVHPDGSIHWIFDRGFPVTDAQGTVRHYAGVAQDITPQKESQLALQEANEFNNQVIRSVQDGIIVIDRDFRYRIWSPAMERISGMRAADVLGKTPMQLFPFLQEVGVWAMLQRAMAGETISSPDFQFQVPETGHQGWSWQLMGPLRSTDGSIIGVITTVREITDRKRDEELLRQSYDRFSVLSSATFEGIVIHQDARVIDCNEQFSWIVGYERAELIGLDVRTIIAPEAREAVMANITAGRDSDLELAMVRKDHSRVIVEARGRIATYAGKPVRITAVRDITHRLRMQEMALQTEKMLSIGGLAAGMAHEINNPLAIMVQNAEVVWQRISTDSPANRAAAQRAGVSLESIRSYMADREILQMLKTVHDSGDRAATIVKNMRSFSRPQTGGKTLSRLQDLVEQAIALLQSDLELKNRGDLGLIKIVRGFDDEVPAVTCHPGEIQQVMLNLLKNAAYACLANRGATPRIAVRVSRDADQAIIQVEDNGTGIAESIRRRVFEPFFTTKPPGEGTGLGLFISYFIATEHHGGSMGVTPNPGGGSCFEVRLPLTRQPASNT